MNRIKRVSLFFRVLFQVLFVAMPLLLIVGWASSPDSVVLLGGFINTGFIPAAYAKEILHVLSATERFYGFCISMLPMSIELYILYLLVKLFKLYEQGEIFSLNNVYYLRKIGFALLMTQLLSPIYQALMGLALTLHNPPGHRLMAVTLDQTNIGIIVIGLLVILISWIMSEGCKLREEQQLTI